MEASYAMPDVHWGHGFPIGGVAATDVQRGRVVSPGDVGLTSPAACGGGWVRSHMVVQELAVSSPRFRPR
jgi:RNA-splicing ligase RtcB